MTLDLVTQRLKLHRKSLEEMKAGMEDGDEMCNDFYHAYLYHQEHYPDYNLDWFCLWDFYLDGKVIGGACFKGQPDENGCVEIGYGIDDDFQNQGFATEAITRLTEWALAQEDVKGVLFEIEKENAASIKVAERIGAVVKEEQESVRMYCVQCQ